MLPMISNYWLNNENVVPKMDGNSFGNSPTVKLMQKEGGPSKLGEVVLQNTSQKPQSSGVREQFQLNGMFSAGTHRDDVSDLFINNKRQGRCFLVIISSTFISEQQKIVEVIFESIYNSETLSENFTKAITNVDSKIFL